MQEMQETWVRSLGREDLLEEEMATHSSILAWRIPMDGGAWRATVQKSPRVRVRAHTHIHTQSAIESKMRISFDPAVFLLSV